MRYSKRRFIYPSKGVPQGGIISPLLSNLVLHEFDVFIRSLIQTRNQENSKLEKTTIINPKYNSLSSQIRRLRGRLADDFKSVRKELRKAIKERNRHRSTLPNPMYLKYSYVRYADDWLIGVWGPIKEVKALKQLVWDFLNNLKLELSMEKTLITNTRKEKARFLGVLISRNTGFHTTNIKTGRKNRIAASSVVMNAPLPSLIDKLEKNKFIKTRVYKLIPQVVLDLTPLPLRDLILYYRSILKGIMNYYSFADNLTSLRRIYNLLLGSLIKTICHKERINREEFVKSYGRYVKLNILRSDGTIACLDFLPPVLKKRPMNFLTKHNPDPLKHRIWKIDRLDPLNQPCSNCGSKDQIEMHHIKHIKTMNVKLSSYDKMVAKINRKQVPLCRACHLKVHNGTYFGFSLKFFKFKKWAGSSKWA